MRRTFFATLRLSCSDPARPLSRVRPAGCAMLRRQVHQNAAACSVAPSYSTCAGHGVSQPEARPFAETVRLNGTLAFIPLLKLNLLFHMNRARARRFSSLRNAPARARNIRPHVSCARGHALSCMPQRRPAPRCDAAQLPSRTGVLRSGHVPQILEMFLCLFVTLRRGFLK